MTQIIANTSSGKYFVIVVGYKGDGKIIVETLDGKLSFIVELSDLIFI